MISWLREAEPSDSRLEGEQEVLCVWNRAGLVARSGTSVRECSVLSPRLGGRGARGSAEAGQREGAVGLLAEAGSRGRWEAAVRAQAGG